MPVRCFVALDPDPELTALLHGYKRQTRALVGDQLYLGDPPHLTVYLATFPDEASLLRDWSGWAGGLPVPRIRVTGWHVFAADALAGGANTLVTALAPEDKDSLRAIQHQVVGHLAPLRDVAATAKHLDSRLALLTPEQRVAVAQTGFPFLGAGWEPHLTVAAVRPPDWPAVWAALGPQPPAGRFTCPRVNLYRITGSAPELLATHSL